MTPRPRARRATGPAVGLSLALLTALAACGGGRGEGEPVAFTVPPGAGFAAVTDTLAARGLVARPGAFRVYARMRGADTEVRSGTYRIAGGTGWRDILDILTRGQVTTVAMTVPEGWTLRQMAPRIAEITGDPVERVVATLTADSAHLEWGVPGPGLEGYLFPDTYRFARGVSLDAVIGEMVEAYREFWTPARRAALDSLGLGEREIVTLASITQAEARHTDEMPTIASVYHNRVADGWLLQADPTVLYPLGGTRERLLFAMIDSVADNPYNTYTNPGLPPGPIGAPGFDALAAALHPAETGYYYFVADAEGRHVFSRTLAEHNAAVAEYRRRMQYDR